MSARESRKSSNEAVPETSKLFDDAIIGEHERSTGHKKSGAKVATPESRRLPGKTDARFWLPRLFRKRYPDGSASPYYSMRIQFRGQRMAFSLRTTNKDAASRRAAALYNELLAHGIDTVLAKYRAQEPETPQEIATIGQWIESASKVFAGKPSTFGSYARALRFIASEILATRKDKKRFAQQHAETYRRKIDAAPISILTPESIQAWRIRYVAKAGDNPARQRAARITCNSTLRAAKALFARKVLKFTGGVVLLDPPPFAGVEFYPRESMRYHSKIDPQALLRAASEELAGSDQDAFKALILALGAGLRRGEIDRLLWRQVDVKHGLIHVEVTEASSLKSADSTGSVAIDESLASILQGFRAKSQSDFVIEEGASSADESKPWGRRYRCQGVFARLMLWLRKNGVESRAPIHTLRKEAGSIIAAQAGIFAASRFLRHADLQVTAAHYVSVKERSTVDMSSILPPKNVIPIRPRQSKRAN
jgi:integrase